MALKGNKPKVASEMLADFKDWLITLSLNPTSYHSNAKSLLQKYEGGSVKKLIESYGKKRSRSYRSQIKRFKEFLNSRGIDSLINDLEQNIEPGAVPIIRCFLIDIKKRLPGKNSSSTYARVLSSYFRFVRHDLSSISVTSAKLFLVSRPLSFQTRQLYKSILKSFCLWALKVKALPKSRLSKNQSGILHELKQLSAEAMDAIVSIDVRDAEDTEQAPKTILSFPERNKLLAGCKDPRGRAIISLLAWNGLRVAELPELDIDDFDFDENTISIQSNGTLNTIVLFKTPRTEIKKYLSTAKLKRGKLFPEMNRQQIDRLVANYLSNGRSKRKREKYAQFNLRNTAGRLLVESGVRLDDVQRTLRLSSLERIKTYVPEDNGYFKRMPADLTSG